MTKTKMTAAEAKKFDYTSPTNAATAEEEVAEKFGCECEAYRDIFTFKRWLAQGMVVKRGETATKVPVITKRWVEEDGKKREVRLVRMVPVFCRHQVTKLKEKAAEKAA